METQHGLEWEETTFGYQPQWNVEPSIDIVKELACRQLNLSAVEQSESTVSLKYQGAFNKLYAFDCSQGSYMMRVTLPVDPRNKTLSETATLKYLSSETSIPVPKVLGYDASTKSDLGFEWMMMERILANDLRSTWPSMDWAAKVALVKKVVDVMAQLFRLRFPCIGNLFPSQDLQTSTTDDTQHAAEGVVGRIVNVILQFFQLTMPDVRAFFRTRVPQEEAAAKTSPAGSVVVDRIVSMPFFWNHHFAMDVPRGPFSSSKDWLLARLAFEEGDCERILENKDADPDDVEDAERSMVIISRLKKHLPNFFPPDFEEKEIFALHHDDISRQNILVDDAGVLQALVDWECVSVLPLWKACQIPHFLVGPDRQAEPNPDQYGRESDGTITSLFDMHVDEYERTLLRKVFLDEMEVVAPEWILEHERAMGRSDFELAVERCNHDFGRKRCEKWLDSLDVGGEYKSLRAEFRS